jgi:hypothetical protein
MSKKKLLFGFVGQFRTFEQTYANIYENLIQPNEDEFDITLVINTDITNNNTELHGDDLCYKTILSKEILETKLHSLVKNIKYIYYFNYSRDIVNPPHELFGLRISQILQEEDKNNIKYDNYIFCRLDVVINKKIIVSYLPKNLLYMISGNLYRVCNTYCRDWDYIWISDYKSLMTFMYGYTEYNNFYKYKSPDKNFSKLFDYYDTIKNNKLDENEIQLVREKFGFDGTTDWDRYFKTALFLMLKNDCSIKFSEVDDVYSQIIR